MRIQNAAENSHAVFLHGLLTITRGKAMFHKGATAVTASKSSGYFVAVKREGIFHYSLETGWKKLFHLKSKIHSITYIGPYLFGVGEKGTVIRSSDQGRSWTMSSFPTNATVWAITGQKDGFVCAHGKHCIYLSDDYGVSWQVAKPFSSFLHPPVIRSLCLHGDTLLSARKYIICTEGSGRTILSAKASG